MTSGDFVDPHLHPTKVATDSNVSAATNNVVLFINDPFNAARSEQEQQQLSSRWSYLASFKEGSNAVQNRSFRWSSFRFVGCKLRLSLPGCAHFYWSEHYGRRLPRPHPPSLALGIQRQGRDRLSRRLPAWQSLPLRPLQGLCRLDTEAGSRPRRMAHPGGVEVYLTANLATFLAVCSAVTRGLLVAPFKVPARKASQVGGAIVKEAAAMPLLLQISISA